MKKVKLFSGKEIAELEIAINEWLSQNRNIDIAASNITGVAGDIHTFYILYSSGAISAAQEIKEMLEETPMANEAPAIAQQLSENEEHPSISNKLKS